MALVTLALVIVLGGLTVFLNDGWFIMQKSDGGELAVCYTAFFGSHFIGQRLIIERFFGHAILLEAQQWVPSFAWIAFFIFSVYSTSSLPISFRKTYGSISNSSGSWGQDFIFLIIQGVWISKHGLEVQTQPEDDQNA